MHTKLSNNEIQLHKKLEEGMVIPIYLESDKGTYRFECMGLLVEKLEPVISPEPYPFKNESSPNSINAIKEKWKVTIHSNSPFDHGREIIRWIPRFHSKGVIPIREIIFEEWLYENEEE